MAIPDDEIEVFCANLEKLYLVGKNTLPAMAGEYSSAAAALGKAGTSAEGLGDREIYQPFQTYGHAAEIPDNYYAEGGGALQPDTGSSFESWERLRDEFNRVINNTSDNLITAGAALLLAVREYADEDEVHAKLIEGESGGKEFISESDLNDLARTDDSGVETPEDLEDFLKKE